MAGTNLTKSSFLIYIEDPTKYLTNIFWESCTEIGMTADVIRTSNGRQRYMMGTKPTPKPITVSKAGNTEEDFKVNQWLENFCIDTPQIDGLADTGAVLMLVPLKPCMANDPYPQRIKVFNLIPTDWSVWDADIMNTTDVARTTITFQWSRYTMTA